MALVKVKPTSAGRRSLVKVVNPLLHKGFALGDAQVRAARAEESAGLGTRRGLRKRTRTGPAAPDLANGAARVGNGSGGSREPFLSNGGISPKGG